MQIKKTFEKDIYRVIEKVITFGNASEDYLDKEISEYVVTEKLKENFENILDALFTGMTYGSNEIGIWVSGFYGSGKSSFAKYLGFALDSSIKVGGSTFTERLINRIGSSQASTLLKNIIGKHDPAIVLLDCSNELIGGKSRLSLLDMLIVKVNQIAGYSTDTRLSYLEKMLERDDKLDEFKDAVLSQSGKDWDVIKVNSLLEANIIAAKEATKLYPNIWEDTKAFRTTPINDISIMQKVEELLSTILSVTGKRNVIFIVDELGQYLSDNVRLLLSFLATLECLKDIGGGKAWLIVTAQETLLEGSPMNTKVHDRFSNQVQLEVHEIEEIWIQRLLAKSPKATVELKSFYGSQKDRLKQFFKFENRVKQKYFNEHLDEQRFISLYPFLPHHFAIINSLLDKISNDNGIKGYWPLNRVILKILRDKLESENKPLVEFEIGKLVTTYHIYDALRYCIKTSNCHIVDAVDKILREFGDDSYSALIVKSIGILQLLDDFQVSSNSLVVLMKDQLESEDSIYKINECIIKLSSAGVIKLGESDNLMLVDDTSIFTGN